MSEAILTINGKPIKGVVQGNFDSIEYLGAAVAAEAKEQAPVKHGQLRNSIMWKTDRSEGAFNDSGGDKAEVKISSSPKATEGYVGTALNYGFWQEFGTRYMAPSPFLRPAIAIVAQGQKAIDVMIKVNQERMRGALKEGQKRETFI